ncbi:MAG: ComF family protein [Oscillospiraceae bacterium]|jgi:ComF family protein|nr:ComF family protein [Oscillospiraceae bacterium]
MKVFNTLLDLLYPPKCVFCGKLLKDNETDFCKACRATLPRVDAPIKRGEFFDRCYSVVYYEKDIAQAVKRLKFSGMQQYARPLGQLMAMQLLSERVEFDVLTWVPISKKRLRKRGYDQSRLLAQAVAQELGVQCVSTLQRVKDRLPQSSIKDYAARRGNVKNAYVVGNPSSVRGKRVLLLDDVITSGATLSECSFHLKLAGATQVQCASFAAARIHKVTKKSR